MKELITHCRKCGREMVVERLDPYSVKLTCSCGFSDFLMSVEKSLELKPVDRMAVYSPIRMDETRGIVFEMERSNRERMEIITLEEISMLISSDYNLEKVLSQVVEKSARRLKVDVCSVYLMKEDELVLSATYGLDPVAVGRVKLKLGEGITGCAALQKKHISLKNASEDPRYRYFPETREEKYNSMLSVPICQKDEVLGVLNVQTVPEKEFEEDEIYFVSIVANLILGAIRIRRVKEAAAGR